MAPVGSELTACVFEVNPDGFCIRPSSDGIASKTIRADAELRVAVARPDSGAHLPIRIADGMSVEPTTFYADPQTGFWMVRNSGRTNTLRVQAWGLRPFPLRPQGATALPSAHVAVWIPILPAGVEPGHRGESFRVVIARATMPPPLPNRRTKNVTDTKARGLSDAQKESILLFFGEFLSWPPLAAPRVRTVKELEDEVVEPGRRFQAARQRLVDKDGLFKGNAGGRRDWYPPSGATGSPETYLPALERLIELGAITLPQAHRWTIQFGLADKAPIDQTLLGV